MTGLAMYEERGGFSCRIRKCVVLAGMDGVGFFEW